MRSIIIIAHDIRSTHNVGSLLRTAEGLGVERVILSGFTPYPVMPNDSRLPHIAQKLHQQIKKTALDAETLVPWEQSEDIIRTLEKLKIDGYTVIALEQTEESVQLPDLETPDKVALLLGREVEGIDSQLLIHCDLAVEIPMFGKKESFNVIQAAAMALYHCRFSGN